MEYRVAFHRLVWSELVETPRRFTNHRFAVSARTENQTGPAPTSIWLDNSVSLDTFLRNAGLNDVPWSPMFGSVSEATLIKIGIDPAHLE